MIQVLRGLTVLDTDPASTTMHVSKCTRYLLMCKTLTNGDVEMPQLGWVRRDGCIFMPFWPAALQQLTQELDHKLMKSQAGSHAISACADTSEQEWGFMMVLHSRLEALTCPLVPALSGDGD